MLIIAFLFLTVLLGYGHAAAQVIHSVDNIGTCSGRLPCSATIMEAVNAAVALDAIEVFPGVYHESVTFAGKDHITLRAQAKARPPVIASLVMIVASPGTQVLNLILEGGLDLFFSVDEIEGASPDVLIEGNLFPNGGMLLYSNQRGTVRNNTVLGYPGIRVRGGEGWLIEGNTVIGSGIVVSGFWDLGVQNNTIRRNVVRGDGISLIAGLALNGDNTLVTGNLVEANFVSGGTYHGIHIYGRPSSTNTIRQNTSIENVECDIYDAFGAARWSGNRFFTKCGSATN